MVQLWTDGACSGNPGPGGWAAILISGDFARERAGSEAHTTNNRMELLAVVEGLRLLTRPVAVSVHLDSQYVHDAVAKSWLAGWQRRGWKTASKAPVKNQDLWEQLLVQLDRHQVSMVKVKGHAGVATNERCDVLACEGRDAAKRGSTLEHDRSLRLR